MDNSLTNREQFPVPTEPDQDRLDGAKALQLHYDAFNLLYDGIYAGNESVAHRIVDRIDNFQPDLDSVRAGLSAQQRAATKRELVECLAVLVRSFPDRQGEDATVFGRALAEEAGRLRPSIGGLHAACGELRRTLKRPLYIADLVEALTGAEAATERWVRGIEKLPGQRELILQRLVAVKHRAA